MQRIGIAHLRVKVVADGGEHFQHLRASVHLLNLALKHEVINEEALGVFVYDFRQARNADEVLSVQQILLRILYREAIDFSDILFAHGSINQDYYFCLKAKLAKGKESTALDLANDDNLIMMRALAASKISTPEASARQISSGLRRVQQQNKRKPT